MQESSSANADNDMPSECDAMCVCVHTRMCICERRERGREIKRKKLYTGRMMYTRCLINGLCSHSCCFPFLLEMSRVSYSLFHD